MIMAMACFNCSIMLSSVEKEVHTSMPSLYNSVYLSFTRRSEEPSLLAERKQITRMSGSPCKAESICSSSRSSMSPSDMMCIFLPFSFNVEEKQLISCSFSLTKGTTFPESISALWISTNWLLTHAATVDLPVLALPLIAISLVSMMLFFDSQPLSRKPMFLYGA